MFEQGKSLYGCVPFTYYMLLSSWGNRDLPITEPGGAAPVTIEQDLKETNKMALRANT